MTASARPNPILLCTTDKDALLLFGINTLKEQLNAFSMYDKQEISELPNVSIKLLKGTDIEDDLLHCASLSNRGFTDWRLQQAYDEIGFMANYSIDYLLEKVQQALFQSLYVDADVTKALLCGLIKIATSSKCNSDTLKDMHNMLGEFIAHCISREKGFVELFERKDMTHLHSGILACIKNNNGPKHWKLGDSENFASTLFDTAKQFFSDKAIYEHEPNFVAFMKGHYRFTDDTSPDMTAFTLELNSVITDTDSSLYEKLSAANTLICTHGLGPFEVANLTDDSSYKAKIIQHAIELGGFQE